MKDPNTGEWLEPSVGTDMSNADGRHFKKDPAINVISKEEFEERVEKVFHLLWQTLAKSFGPYGAPTIIYNYPYSHVTKDGYTIMKNLSMDASETKVDQCIADMAGDICGRLNYTVGDGTTSAIIATNSIYKSYRELRNDVNKLILPRDVIHRYEIIKEEIIAGVRKKVKQIRTQDKEQLRKNIYDVVYISSNGDEIITNYIADLYAELGAPAISCALAPDGITKKKLINGYKYDLVLNDRLYINSDNNTMDLTNADVIVFSTKITKATYEKILKPLNENARIRGRHLIVAAPTYDEMALQQVISVDLNNEYRRTHDCNMVLTTYRAISAHTKKLVNDFAILMGTVLIDRSLEQRILEEIESGNTVNQIFNIDSRKIKGLKCIATNGTKNGDESLVIYNKDEDVLPDGYTPLYESMSHIENSIDLGFVKSCSLGLKDSLFKDMVYDKKQYDVIVADAKADLDEKEKKYQKLGTFNVEVAQAQERLYALNLRMGIIEVGADSELSQKLLKDAVDDAIKAASSAFNHGVILGCNVNLIQAIEETMDITDTEHQLDYILKKILRNGFKDVYKTVLSNAFKDENVCGEGLEELYVNVKMYFDEKGINADDLFDNRVKLYDVIMLCAKNHEVMSNNKAFMSVSVHDVIVEYSIATSKVLDISKFKFADDVINSCQTDEEILKATIDLMTLLITGNQMVVTMKHNFE